MESKLTKCIISINKIYLYLCYRSKYGFELFSKVTLQALFFIQWDKTSALTYKNNKYIGLIHIIKITVNLSNWPSIHLPVTTLRNSWWIGLRMPLHWLIINQFPRNWLILSQWKVPLKGSQAGSDPVRHHQTWLDNFCRSVACSQPVAADNSTLVELMYGMYEENEVSDITYKSMGWC